MADIHVTRELLWAVARGEVAASAITRIGIEHLMSLCSTCRREITAFQKDRAGKAAADYDRAFQLIPILLAEQVPRFEREQRAAARDLADLLALPAQKRAGKVARARNRFRSAALVRLLIAESRRRVLTDPEESFHLAELGRVVAHHNPQMPDVFGIIALTTAQMANARRVGGDRREAEEHFGHVRYIVTHHGVTDPEVLARVDKLEGSLRMDQRRFREAEELLARAAMLYRVSGEKVEAARVLVTLGSMYFFRGDLTRAVDATTLALQRLRGSHEPRLYLCARYNLARYLVEDGQHAKAAEILRVDEDLYREFPEAWTQRRLSWLQGKLAACRGESDVAERIFLEVRDGFIADGIGYDAAMVSIEDLAPLYLHLGRTADLRRLAEEMLPIFQAQDVHREAVAALLLFQQAARQETLTLKGIREYVRYLRDARTDPACRFRDTRPS